MHITYFSDSDTIDIDFRATRGRVHDAVDGPNPDILIDLDESGRLVGMTIDHASERLDLESLRLQRQFEEMETAKEIG